MLWGFFYSNRVVELREIKPDSLEQRCALRTIRNLHGGDDKSANRLAHIVVCLERCRANLFLQSRRANETRSRLSCVWALAEKI